MYLFRGLKKYTKEWVEGNLACNENRAFILKHRQGESSRAILHWDEFEVIPETVGLATGRNDVNGKMIFEGDKVKGSFPYASMGIIVWDKNDAGFL